MRASPIVEIQPKQLKQDNQQKSESESKSVGFPTRVSSFYKTDLIKALNEKKKTLYLKFEILSKANLKDSLQKGCRILQMNCNIVQNGGIVLEDHVGRAEFVPYAELKEIFTSRSAISTTTPQEQTNTSLNANTSPNTTITTQKLSTFASEHFLDLLILGSKNDFATANFFADEMKIPHVISFKFLNKEFDFRHKMYEDHCIDKFSQFLLEELVDGFSVRESFSVAYQRTFDSLSETFFESRDNSYVRNIIGEGPILLPENADHSEVLYGVDDYTLNDGRIEDISSVRYPTNIPKTLLPYTGRNNDIYAVVKLILKFQFLKLSGETGIGKTAFALHAGYFLLARNIFPDGIFYFPLKNMKNSLKDMMKETFGPKFDNNMKNFFRDKKMLLIFDDFDVFYQKGHEFPRLIFLTLRECEIATLVITTLRRKQEVIMKKKWQQEYDAHKKAIEDEFLGTERILKPMKDEEMAHILLSMIKIDKNMDVDIDRIKACQAIRLAEGNPRALINSLIEKKVLIDKKPLEINPRYVDHVHLDQNIHHLPVNHRAASMQGVIQRQDSTDSGLKLSKLTKTHSHGKDSLQGLKNNPRSKSYTTHGLTSRLAQEEKKEREKSNLGETHRDRSHDKSDDDLTRTSKRFHGKMRPMTTKLNREKSYSSKNDSISEFPKKDSSVSEENHIPFDSAGMDYYEEQKSNDADELLRGLSSNEDEKDDVFHVNMDDSHTDSNSEDELALPDDDKGYHSHEEIVGFDMSVNDTMITFGESFDGPAPSGLSVPGNDSTMTRGKTTFNDSMKKKGGNQHQKEDHQKKKKSHGKGQKSGKQVNRFAKSKKNKYMANRDGGSGNKRKGSTGSEED